MITFHLENLDSKLFNEMMPLLRASMEEVYLNKDNLTLANSMNLDNILTSKVDYVYYMSQQEKGNLKICTMRHNGNLIGHYTTLITYHAQSKNLKVANTQNIHILKEYRKIKSKDFMLFTEGVLKSAGVNLIYLGVNPKLGTDKMLEHMGFTIDEVVYSKGI